MLAHSGQPVDVSERKNPDRGTGASMQGDTVVFILFDPSRMIVRNALLISLALDMVDHCIMSSRGFCRTRFRNRQP